MCAAHNNNVSTAEHYEFGSNKLRHNRFKRELVWFISCTNCPAKGHVYSCIEVRKEVKNLLRPLLMWCILHILYNGNVMDGCDQCDDSVNHTPSTKPHVIQKAVNANTFDTISHENVISKMHQWLVRLIALHMSVIYSTCKKLLELPPMTNVIVAAGWHTGCSGASVNERSAEVHHCTCASPDRDNRVRVGMPRWSSGCTNYVLECSASRWCPL